MLWAEWVFAHCSTGKMLAAAIAGARTVVVPGAGHMLMNERPDELLAALRG